jgi:hypothetical protein
METLYNCRANGVERSGFLNDAHKNHRRGYDQDRIHVREHALHEMYHGNSLPANQSTGDRSQHHGYADWQLAQEAAQQERSKHHDEGNQFDAHKNLLGTT